MNYKYMTDKQVNTFKSITKEKAKLIIQTKRAIKSGKLYDGILNKTIINTDSVSKDDVDAFHRASSGCRTHDLDTIQCYISRKKENAVLNDKDYYDTSWLK